MEVTLNGGTKCMQIGDWVGKIGDIDKHLAIA